MNKAEAIILFMVVVGACAALLVSKLGVRQYRVNHSKWKPALRTDADHTALILTRYGFPDILIGVIENNAGNYDQKLLELESAAMERCALLNSTHKELG